MESDGWFPKTGIVERTGKGGTVADHVRVSICFSDVKKIYMSKLCVAITL